jgi:hypothetical protein
MGLRLQISGYTATSERPLFRDQHPLRLLAAGEMRPPTTAMSAKTATGSGGQLADGPRFGDYHDPCFDSKHHARW